MTRMVWGELTITNRFIMARMIIATDWPRIRRNVKILLFGVLVISSRFMLHKKLLETVFSLKLVSIEIKNLNF